MMYSANQNILVTVDRRGYMDWRMRMSWWNPPDGNMYRSWTGTAATKRGAYRKATRLYELVNAWSPESLSIHDTLLICETEDDIRNLTVT